MIIFLYPARWGRQPVTLLAERGAAPARPASSAGLPGGLGSPSAPTTGGRPFQGWTGQDERGESPAIGLAKSQPSESRKHGPEAQNRRGGAPEGVPLPQSARRARWKAAEDKVLRLPALRLHPLAVAGGLPTLRAPARDANLWQFGAQRAAACRYKIGQQHGGTEWIWESPAARPSSAPRAAGSAAPAPCGSPRPAARSWSTGSIRSGSMPPPTTSASKTGAKVHAVAGECRDQGGPGRAVRRLPRARHPDRQQRRTSVPRFPRARPPEDDRRRDRQHDRAGRAACSARSTR